MHVLDDKHLQETYEKLTDVPLVTEDSRPMLACYLCYAKLKQSYRLQRRCLEAEKWFEQILSEDCETKPTLNRDPLLFSGYIISPIVHVSTLAEYATEKDDIKEEILIDTLIGDSLELKEERESEPELEWNDIEYEYVEPDIPAENSESDSDDDIPLTKVKADGERDPQVTKTKRKATKKKRLSI
ncbi:hypothetical protein PYW07_012560 [Mythimna separata]|uniref:ZAD domain-containing protein n=1 Tax=Mythimna separata TaxID=271217 RepID=A0AAD7Y8E9_MYTSE|nr:hypothetical protein PYW07_012560 [Mythimna separata]